MKIKWERNSRALALEAQGKIKSKDIIPKTTTDNFPFEAATVRMKQVTEKYPHITVHIRGAKKTKQFHSYSYEYGPTCRVNFGGSWLGKENTAMDSNGDLEEGLTWLDVHNVVERTKKALAI